MFEPIVMTIRSTARSYLEVSFHRKWLLVIPVIFSTLLAFGYSYTVAPMYQSDAVIEVDEQVMKNPFISAAFSREARPTSLADQWRHILAKVKSRSQIEYIVLELNLHENLKTEEEFRALVERVQENVSLIVSGRLLKIRCQFQDPIATQRIVNIIAREFIKENLEAQKRETFSGEEFLKREAELYLAELEKKNAEIREMQLAYSELLPGEATQNIYFELGWADPSGESRYPAFQHEALSHLSLVQHRYHYYSTRLVEYSLQLKELESIRTKIIEQLEGQSELIVTERLSETNPVVRSLRDEKTRKEVELARLLVDATTNHPTVQRLNTEIANLEKALEDATEVTVREEKTSINPVYQSLQTELSGVERQIDGINTRISITKVVLEELFKKSQDAPKKQQELAKLQREVAILQDRYWSRIRMLGQVEVSQRLEFDQRGTQFRIIDDAQLPISPFKPNKKLYVVGGFFFGLALGAGLIVLAETTDHSFKEPNQLREFMPIPMLGATSRIVTPEEQSFENARRKLAFLSVVVVMVFILITIGLIIAFSGRMG